MLLKPVEEARQVCYEVWPDWAHVQGRRVQVGFEVDLCATCEARAPAGAREYERWVDTFDGLKHLAKSIMPPDCGEVEFELLPYDNAVHESLRRGFRPEVVLAIRIVRRCQLAPVNGCEERCLRQVENRLKELGIPRAN